MCQKSSNCNCNQLLTISNYHNTDVHDIVHVHIVVSQASAHLIRVSIQVLALAIRIESAHSCTIDPYSHVWQAPKQFLHTKGRLLRGHIPANITAQSQRCGQQLAQSCYPQQTDDLGSIESQFSVRSIYA